MTANTVCVLFKKYIVKCKEKIFKPCNVTIREKYPQIWNPHFYNYLYKLYFTQNQVLR